MTKTPVLYIFVRTEMPSMTPGKAQAHSGHAANAFVFENFIKTKSNNALVKAWIHNETAQGFGTQINLKGSWDQITDAVTQAISRGVIANFVTDPTYPYEVDAEVFELLSDGIHSADPVFKDNGRVVCFRAEQTAAYIFGDKEELESIVGKFPLHP